MEKAFSIVSLGCFRNTYDSEVFISKIVGRGYTFLPSDSLPDLLEKIDFSKDKILKKSGIKKNKSKFLELLVVNTCGFIDKAKEESISIISSAVDLKKKGKVKKVIVIGCLVSRYQKELKSSFPLVDEWQSVVEFSQKYSKRDKLLSQPAVGFLKICEGCLNSCSFCAIPIIKGSLRSKLKKEIVSEAKFLDKKGVKELNIIGQDITSWGMDLKSKGDLSVLLKEILRAVKGVKRIRLIYTHPRHFSDSLIELIAKEERICKYIDLPIQHINDRILKLMNRGITGKEIKELIKKIRRKIPGCVIRSSVIVGFPTESESEYKELLDFLGDIKFERLGAFVYSREEGTQAFGFRPQVHHNTKKKRLDLIMRQQKKIANKVNKRFFNKELEVLIESKESGVFIGRSQYDAPDVDGVVYLKKKGLKAGDFYKAKIVDCLEYDLVGK